MCSILTFIRDWPMKNENKKQPEKKKVWQDPELIVYGSVEKITLKGFGVSDGSALDPRGTHPSM
jgi:hypothetical protein